MDPGATRGLAQQLYGLTRSNFRVLKGSYGVYIQD